MDSFETIVAKFLEAKNYWVRTIVKVKLTKKEKRVIENPTTPTPEIDMLAYNIKENELIIIEARSSLDSKGVRLSSIRGNNERAKKRYKLFNNKKYRNMISRKLRKEFLSNGLINKETKINYGLAAGNVYKPDEDNIKKYFERKEWKYFSPNDIKETLKNYSSRSYENDVVVITAKILAK